MALAMAIALAMALALALALAMAMARADNIIHPSSEGYKRKEKQMTNAEKFKTAEERAKEYKKYCSSHRGCHKCGLNKYAGSVCRYAWLDLEYKEELMPCPFCGSEASINSGTEDHYVVCRNDDCAAALIARSFSSIEEAIAAWNRRAK